MAILLILYILYPSNFNGNLIFLDLLMENRLGVDFRERLLWIGEIYLDLRLLVLWWLVLRYFPVKMEIYCGLEGMGWFWEFEIVCCWDLLSPLSIIQFSRLLFNSLVNYSYHYLLFIPFSTIHTLLYDAISLSTVHSLGYYSIPVSTIQSLVYYSIPASTIQSLVYYSIPCLLFNPLSTSHRKFMHFHLILTKNSGRHSKSLPWQLVISAKHP